MLGTKPPHVQSASVDLIVYLRDQGQTRVGTHTHRNGMRHMRKHTVPKHDTLNGLGSAGVHPRVIHSYTHPLLTPVEFAPSPPPCTGAAVTGDIEFVTPVTPIGVLKSNVNTPEI